jgi:3-hydroxy-9,10-secoandrosta-1,3,5(10)-triene-9,17-dione monooxygenase reductase component
MNIATIKDAMSRFVTGVTVVTTHHEGTDYGMTCNSFNTVSLEPPLVMWCIRKNSHSHEAFTRSTGYVVNVLSASQTEIAMKFTQGSHLERFAAVDCNKTVSGMQRLNRVAAWFDCTLEQVVSAGDHDILIGRVNAVGTHNEASLVYAQRQFGFFMPSVGDH